MDFFDDLEIALAGYVPDDHYRTHIRLCIFFCGSGWKKLPND